MVSARFSRHRQSGVTIVEFSIVALVFFLLLFATVEGARYIYSQTAVAHAAREGVRYAIVRGNDAAKDSLRADDAPASKDQISSFVNQRSSLNGLTVTTTWNLDSDDVPIKDSGQPVTVSVSYQFQSAVPFIPSANLTSASTGVIYF
ncbi:TadE/TadG family type IV pilus assembly protein [Vibrio maerlii]|uniref:TadE/TadG family type IV pilus assembly protein n=1 Tax=Vibrio maerlii TaxID=2231648 RepID=UPI000E3DA956|nr:TadE/TadG family type IV pilus assembly protein [Vibrio maerlii]